MDTVFDLWQVVVVVVDTGTDGNFLFPFQGRISDLYNDGSQGKGLDSQRMIRVTFHEN